MPEKVVSEVLQTCPHCQDNDGIQVPLIITGQQWPYQVIPDRQCPKCDTLYVYTEEKK
jgi:hypothetical protein